MRLVCKYTGIPFHVEHFNQLKLTGHHPIFDVEYRELLAMATTWSRDRYNDTERHLLFVALLKTTGLVDFKTPAVPSQQTIDKYMGLLVETTGWKQAIGDTLSLPGFRVTRDNYTLKGIGGILNRWNELKQEWEGKSTNQQLSEALRVRENFILKRIRQGYIEYRRLAKWVMSAASVPTSVQDHWIQIFELRETEDRAKIWQTSVEDLKALMTHMETFLDAGSTLAEMAFGHVRRLLSINEGGIELSLMDNMDTLQTVNDSPYVILSPAAGSNIVKWSGPTSGNKLPSLTAILSTIGSIDTLQIETDDPQEAYLVQMRPDSKPLPENYPNRLDYIRANAAWEIEAYKVQQHNSRIMSVVSEKKRLDTELALGQDDNSAVGQPDSEEQHIIDNIRKNNGTNSNE